MAPTALEQLARLRTIGARSSKTVLALGKEVLGEGSEKKRRTKLGEEEWAIREQVAIAALDENELNYAKRQISILDYRFPASPRLAILKAMLLEAEGDHARASKVYNGLLGKGKAKEDEVVAKILRGIEADECFVPAHQRLITLFLYSEGVTFPSGSGSSRRGRPRPSVNSILQTLPILKNYLRTFHTDLDAWSVMADLYIILSGYEDVTGIDDVYEKGLLVTQRKNSMDGEFLQQALHCLGQRLLLESWNWMVMTQYGEVALLAGDIVLAYKTFLRSIEFATDPDGPPTTTERIQQDDSKLSGTSTPLDGCLRQGGWKTRTWWDLKITTLILLGDVSIRDRPTLSAPSPAPTHVEKVDELATNRLKSLVGEEVYGKWVEEIRKTGL